MSRRAFIIMRDGRWFRKEYLIEKIQNGETVRVSRCYHEAGNGDPGDVSTQEDLINRPFVVHEGQNEWTVSNENREFLLELRKSEKGQ